MHRVTRRNLICTVSGIVWMVGDMMNVCMLFRLIYFTKEFSDETYLVMAYYILRRHGWWHTVLNLDDGLSVALTQNYVSSSNLGDVLRFLDSRVGQISGCRDRQEAIKPEDLGAELRKAMGEQRPELLQTGDEANAKGWSCKAWTDDFINGAGDVCEGVAKKQKKESSSILDKAKEAEDGEVAGGFGGGGGGFSFGFM